MKKNYEEFLTGNELLNFRCSSAYLIANNVSALSQIQSLSRPNLYNI